MIFFGLCRLEECEIFLVISISLNSKLKTEFDILAAIMSKNLKKCQRGGLTLPSRGVDVTFLHYDYLPSTCS